MVRRMKEQDQEAEVLSRQAKEVRKLLTGNGKKPVFLSLIVIVELLARAKRARSGAPWVRKFGKVSIRENLVMT